VEYLAPKPNVPKRILQAACCQKGWIQELPWLEAMEPWREGKVEKGEVKDGKDEAIEDALNQIAEDGPPADVEVPTFEYGFDTKIMLPWRMRTSTGYKETGLPIELADDAAGDELVQAEWLDSAMQDILFSNVRFRDRVSAGRQSSSAGVLWESKHKVTHNQIIIKQQLIDEHIYEQTRQILQVRMSMWAPIADKRVQHDAHHPAVIAAIEFLAPLAQKYCDAKISIERFRKLKDQGIKHVTPRTDDAAVSTEHTAASAEHTTASKEKATSSKREVNQTVAQPKATCVPKAPELKAVKKASDNMQASKAEVEEKPKRKRSDASSVAPPVWKLCRAMSLDQLIPLSPEDIE
jgi:hypothetical protein